MYEVKKTEYGLYIRVSGSVDPDEAQAILDETRKVVEELDVGFCAFSDLREMELLSDQAQAVCIEIQQMVIKFGVKRVAVALGHPTVAYQFKRLSLQSGIFDYDRYIDSSSEPGWEEKALSWIKDGIDPDAEWREKIAQKRAKQSNPVNH